MNARAHDESYIVHQNYQNQHPVKLRVAATRLIKSSKSLRQKLNSEKMFPIPYSYYTLLSQKNKPKLAD